MILKPLQEPLKGKITKIKKKKYDSAKFTEIDALSSRLSFRRALLQFTSLLQVDLILIVEKIDREECLDYHRISYGWYQQIVVDNQEDSPVY